MENRIFARFVYVDVKTKFWATVRTTSKNHNFSQRVTLNLKLLHSTDETLVCALWSFYSIWEKKLIFERFVHIDVKTIILPNCKLNLKKS